MTCFSSRVSIAYLASLDSAALHEEANNLRTAGNTVHSKSCGSDYVCQQTHIFAAPVSRETVATLLHAKGPLSPPGATTGATQADSSIFVGM